MRKSYKMTASKVLHKWVLVQEPNNNPPKLDLTSALASGSWVIVEINQRVSPAGDLFGNSTITQEPYARLLVKSNF